MKKSLSKLYLKAQNIKNGMLKKRKGALNVVEILVIIALFLIVTYPVYKTTMTNFINKATSWFTTQYTNIFS